MLSYTTILTCSSLALAGYALAWIAYARLFHPLKHIPGPFWASISRLWMVHHLWRGDMDVVQRRLHQEHGPLVRIAPDELEALRDAGAEPARLGETVLRTSTAGPAALAVVSAALHRW